MMHSSGSSSSALNFEQHAVFYAEKKSQTISVNTKVPEIGK
jgi:hypothetical protein